MNETFKVTGETFEATMDARPEPYGFDPRRTAVVVVDMQNDFGAEGGMVDRSGTDISEFRTTIGPTARVLAAARGAGIRVVYLQHGYAPDLSDMGPRGAKNRLVHEPLNVGQAVQAPDGRKSRILVRGTWNTEIVPELAPQEGDFLVGKTRYSGFFRTELDATLRRLEIRDLVLLGWSTSDCVEATARDAFYRDYRTVVLADCTAEPHGPTFHENSLTLIERMSGWVSDSARFLDSLRH